MALGHTLSRKLKKINETTLKLLSPSTAEEPEAADYFHAIRFDETKPLQSVSCIDPTSISLNTSPVTSASSLTDYDGLPDTPDTPHYWRHRVSSLPSVIRNASQESCNVITRTHTDPIPPKTNLAPSLDSSIISSGQSLSLSHIFPSSDAASTGQHSPVQDPSTQCGLESRTSSLYSSHDSVVLPLNDEDAKADELAGHILQKVAVDSQAHCRQGSWSI